MLHTELVTAVAEGIKIIVVLIQNHGYASIGHLSETVGADRFGTLYRKLDPDSLDFQGTEVLPVDLAMNARSYGLDVVEVEPTPNAVADLSAALAAAKASSTSTLIHVNSDPLVYAPDGEGWWDVPVAQVSTLDSTAAALADYRQQRAAQRPLLG
jgi:3D-(3,5/4)-trihydroxycyclohexane-1,2-dione acylhydrolase (decyclizing)